MKNKIILFIIIAIIGGILYLFISRISDLFSPYKEEGGNNNMSLPTTYSNEFSIQDFDYKMIQEVNKN